MPKKKKKIPLRTCIGCGVIKPKKELIRIVRTPEGEVMVDPTGKASGRGAYVCFNADCFDLAVKKNKISSALNTSVDGEKITELRSDLSDLYRSQLAD